MQKIVALTGLGFKRYWERLKQFIGLGKVEENLPEVSIEVLERPACIFKPYKTPDSHWFTKTFLRPRKYKKGGKR